MKANCQCLINQVYQLEILIENLKYLLNRSMYFIVQFLILNVI